MLTGCDPAQNAPQGVPAPVPRQSAGSSETLSLTSGLGQLSSAAGRASSFACRVRFTDVHELAGLNFVFDNGYSPARLMPHSTSGGAGWLDYDGDGWCDLFLPQGGSLTAESWAGQPRDQLFRNVGGTFVAVTGQAGIVDIGYGHGVAVGDFDGDGFDDIYVTNVGPDVLLRNSGDGTFLDITQQAGIDSPQWGSSAAWGDVDRDGDLDLFVCNYVDYDPKHPIACVDDNGNPSTCNPMQISGIANAFYLNLGDGRFRECAAERGLLADNSKSLGVVIADLTDDGEPDVFVANDTTANHFFVNQGQGRFVECAVARGCALSGLGQYQANMGIGFGDYDRNGLPDLYVTHFTTESNTLYQNLGKAGFTDVTSAVGLHLPTLDYLGFGSVMADFDSNGWQDVIIANGHIDDFRKRSGTMWYMRPQLFCYDGTVWHDCGAGAGDYFQHEWLGRPVASADYDRDGDLDLAIVHQNDPASLLRNDSPRGHWLLLRFIGADCNRRGIGVKVTLTQGDLKLVQQLPGGTSYCSSHEPILHFGLGQSESDCTALVEWPSGRRQAIRQLPVDQTFVIRESDATHP
jgi:hypothetical protein